MCDGDDDPVDEFGGAVDPPVARRAQISISGDQLDQALPTRRLGIVRGEPRATPTSAALGMSAGDYHPDAGSGAARRSSAPAPQLAQEVGDSDVDRPGQALPAQRADSWARTSASILRDEWEAEDREEEIELAARNFLDQGVARVEVPRSTHRHRRAEVGMLWSSAPSSPVLAGATTPARWRWRR